MEETLERKHKKNENQEPETRQRKDTWESLKPNKGK